MLMLTDEFGPLSEFDSFRVSPVTRRHEFREPRLSEVETAIFKSRLGHREDPMLGFVGELGGVEGWDGTRCGPKAGRDRPRR
jgi:hypothetical protein